MSALRGKANSPRRKHAPSVLIEFDAARAMAQKAGTTPAAASIPLRAGILRRTIMITSELRADVHSTEPIPDADRDSTGPQQMWIWVGANIAPINWALGSTLRIVMPVMLPPGRLRLATRPSLTGSVPTKKTIGNTGF
jgi:hypothetical protein